MIAGLWKTRSPDRCWRLCAWYKFMSRPFAEIKEWILTSLRTLGCSPAGFCVSLGNFLRPGNWNPRWKQLSALVGLKACWLTGSFHRINNWTGDPSSRMTETLHGAFRLLPQCSFWRPLAVKITVSQVFVLSDFIKTWLDWLDGLSWAEAWLLQTTSISKWCSYNDPVAIKTCFLIWYALLVEAF